jgi:uncharacterized protein (DUF608 family)
MGAGTVEIRPDGYFHEWQIFNLGPWAPVPPAGQQGAMPPMPPGAYSFFLRTAQAGKPPLVRRLGLRPEQQDLYGLSYAQSVESITFDGRFPMAGLEYNDSSLPVSISSEMFSPFFPLDERASGTPGFYSVFHVTNKGTETVSVSLAALLFNPLAWGKNDPGSAGGGDSCKGHPKPVPVADGDRCLHNDISRHGEATAITLSTGADIPCKATLGTMTLSVCGGRHSWIAGDFPDFMRGNLCFRTKCGSLHLSCLHDFRNTGLLPSTSGSTVPDFLFGLSDNDIERHSTEKTRELLARLQDYAFSRFLTERQLRLNPGALSDSAGMKETLKIIKCFFESSCNGGNPGQTWGDSALCSTLELAPGESRDIRFALSWNFPNFYNTDGSIAGHQYEHWFKDSFAVSHYLQDSYDTLGGRTRAFADTLHDTTLPPEFPDSWSSQLSTLAKATWWTREGDFAVWEGIGCCGLNTTDIMYQGSFGILALFPELQKRMMRMNAGVQREDGFVHHVFRGDLKHVDEGGFERVDMNPQFVMLVWRDFLWTGDRKYLRDLWPHVRRAMEAMASLDHDGDCLPDHETKRNTYDAWDFRGASSYISSLALAAYEASARIADALGERSAAAVWRKALRTGISAMEARLWNGKYYSLWVDHDDRDECCMADQLSGEWFAAVTGFGPILQGDRIRQAAQSILRHNFDPEGGLLNAVYPPDIKPQAFTYLNAQATANWTGIEYAFASFLLGLGMTREATAIVRSVDVRHRRAGTVWNHIECGEHYYRAMASWATLISATGFGFDAPRKIVTVSPSMTDGTFRAPWFTPSGWGMLLADGDGISLSVIGGQLEINTLCIGGLSGLIRRASLDKKPLTFDLTMDKGVSKLSFNENVTIRLSGTLELHL